MNGAYGCSGAEFCSNEISEKRLLLTEISWQDDGLFKAKTLEISEAGSLPVLKTEQGSTPTSAMEPSALGHYQILQSQLERRTSPQLSVADLGS
jgi:hypothetical protein